MTRCVIVEFVSDISPRWCIIDLQALERASANIVDLIRAEIRFQLLGKNDRMYDNRSNDLL